jgi:hypothetical protein
MATTNLDKQITKIIRALLKGKRVLDWPEPLIIARIHQELGSTPDTYKANNRRIQAVMRALMERQSVSIVRTVYGYVLKK